MDGLKQEVEINLSRSAAGALPARDCLANLKDGYSSYSAHGLRPPLGIYNISIGKICKKMEKLCGILEPFWVDQTAERNPLVNSPSIDDIIDYVELCLYSAAEHVDAVKAIVKTFYKTAKDARKDNDYRVFLRQLDAVRDELSKYTNAMKHDHARICLCSIHMTQGDKSIWLYGFFIEGYEDGTIVARPINKSKNDAYMSLTGFMWSILVFIFSISYSLAHFLKSIGAVNSSELEFKENAELARAVIALVRLPAYSFDEANPLRNLTFTIQHHDASIVQSNIYGSMLDRWTDTAPKLAKPTWMFVGDGVTNSFRVRLPNRGVTLHKPVA